MVVKRGLAFCAERARRECTAVAGLEKRGGGGPPDRINVNSWGTRGPEKYKNGPF